MERAWADAYIFIRFRSARRLAGARRAGGVRGGGVREGRWEGGPEDGRVKK